MYNSFVEVSKLQVAILARSSRDNGLKLFVSTESTSCHEFASQFDVAIFIREKRPKTIANSESPARLFT